VLPDHWLNISTAARTQPHIRNRLGVGNDISRSRMRSTSHSLSSPRFWTLLALATMTLSSSVVLRTTQGFQIGCVCDGDVAGGRTVMKESAITSGGSRSLHPARDRDRDRAASRILNYINATNGHDVEARHSHHHQRTAPSTSDTSTSPNIPPSFIRSRCPGAKLSIRDFHGITSRKTPTINATDSSKKKLPMNRRLALDVVAENNCEAGGERRGRILFPETMQQILSTSTILMVNLARFLSMGQKKKLMLVFLRSLYYNTQSVLLGGNVISARVHTVVSPPPSDLRT
jgi:hypothetical protein